MMPRTRRILAVTGSRADYGLLYWTLRGIAADPALTLQLVVTGAHLSPAHGNTQYQIEQDGFHIDARIDLALDADDAVAVARALGRAVSGLADAIAQLEPDLVVLLGDRYEILAAAQAAMMLRVPIAHIHGGESTEGAIDESIRHALTKLAHIHCVAAPAYANRVIQMGEQPGRVHVVGAAGFDQLAGIPRLDRKAIQQLTGLRFGAVNLLVTLHPETLSPHSGEQQLAPLLEALDQLDEAQVFLTGSNADPAGLAISKGLQRYAARHSQRCLYRESLGQQVFLSVLAEVDVILGNSSSGIIEAPALGTPTVNLGSRQHRRLKAASIIDCAPDAAAIVAAVRTALSPQHRDLAALRQTPYGTPGAATRILGVLRDTPLDGILHKRFYDLETPEN